MNGDVHDKGRRRIQQSRTGGGGTLLSILLYLCCSVLCLFGVSCLDE